MVKDHVRGSSYVVSIKFRKTIKRVELFSDAFKTSTLPIKINSQSNNLSQANKVRGFKM